MTIDWKGWKPYLCRVNHKPASILVNLDLRDTAPIPSKPWLLWTWVYFQSPRSDGLSSGSEAPALYEIEDALYAKVSGFVMRNLAEESQPRGDANSTSTERPTAAFAVL